MPTTQSDTGRLRRIEGRHNALVKELRQAFDRGELTFHRRVRRRRLSHYRRSRPQRTSLSRRLLQRIGPVPDFAPAAADRRARRDSASAGQAFPQRRSPAKLRKASLRWCTVKKFSLTGNSRPHCHRPDSGNRRSARPRKPGHDSAVRRSFRRKRRPARRRHRERLQHQSRSRLRRISFPGHAVESCIDRSHQLSCALAASACWLLRLTKAVALPQANLLGPGCSICRQRRRWLGQEITVADG